MVLICGVGEDSWESLGLQGDPASEFKGNWTWIFTERTDAEAEAPILWPPDVKNWLIGKDPDAGKDWGQEENRTTEDEMVGWHHQLSGCEREQALGLGDGSWWGKLQLRGVSKRRALKWVTKLKWEKDHSRVNKTEFKVSYWEKVWFSFIWKKQSPDYKIS